MSCIGDYVSNLCSPDLDDEESPYLSVWMMIHSSWRHTKGKVFQAEYRDGKTVSRGYVAGEYGEKYTVHLSLSQLPEEERTRDGKTYDHFSISLIIDGMEQEFCWTEFKQGQEDEALKIDFLGVRAEDGKMAKMEFVKPNLSEDALPLPDELKNALGTIAIQIRRVALAHPELDPGTFGAKGRGMVAEGDKKGMSSVTGFNKTYAANTAREWRSLDYHPDDLESPYYTFEFLARPMAVLQANNLLTDLVIQPDSIGGAVEKAIDIDAPNIPKEVFELDTSPHPRRRVSAPRVSSMRGRSLHQRSRRTAYQSLRQAGSESSRSARSRSRSRSSRSSRSGSASSFSSSRSSRSNFSRNSDTESTFGRRSDTEFRNRFRASVEAEIRSALENMTRANENITLAAGMAEFGWVKDRVTEHNEGPSKIYTNNAQASRQRAILDSIPEELELPLPEELEMNQDVLEPPSVQSHRSVNAEAGPSRQPAVSSSLEDPMQEFVGGDEEQLKATLAGGAYDANAEDGPTPRSTDAIAPDVVVVDLTMDEDEDEQDPKSAHSQQHHNRNANAESVSSRRRTVSLADLEQEMIVMDLTMDIDEAETESIL